MAQENELSAADIAALSGVAAGGAYRLREGVKQNARLDTATKTAQAQYEKAYRAREAIAKQFGPNGAIPTNHKLYPQFKSALDAEKQALARIAQFKGQVSTLGKIGATPLLGKASSAMSKMGTKGKIAAGVLATGAGMAGSAALTDSDDEMRQKVYNKLRYGHYVTDKELKKKGTLTETGNIGEGGLSEQEFENYWQKNKEAFGRQYGGNGNLVNMGSQIVAGIANPLAGLFGSVGADAYVNSAEDKFNMSMADSLASQAQGRRVRNNADLLYGDKFAAGLLGEYKPLENMMGVDNNVRQVIKPYVDPATAAAQLKAKTAYDSASDLNPATAIMRQNAATDGGRRWFQDVNSLTNYEGVDPEVMRQAQAALMQHQGLINKDDLSEMYYGKNQNQIQAEAAQAQAQAQAQAAKPSIPAGVVQNANSGMSNVRNPMSQNINIPTPTNPQDAENLMRTRSIMSGETNVAGAIGQSQAAYMNNRGMLTSNQQNNAISDWRKSYWESRGVKGFDYTPPPKPAQPAQPAAPTIGPSTLPSNQMVNSTPLGPFGGSRNRYNDTSEYDFNLSGVPRQDTPSTNQMPSLTAGNPNSRIRFRAGQTPY